MRPPAKPVTKECYVCNKVFTCSSSRQSRITTCSETCAAEKRRQSIASQDLKVTCKMCGKEELVNPSRAKGYVTCSRICMGKLHAINYDKRVAVQCKNCNNSYQVKPCRVNRTVFCSTKCRALYNSAGDRNPNYKKKGVGWGGYEVTDGLNKKYTHRKIAIEYLGLESVPKNFVVHHRDCNKLNNNADNLVICHRIDHGWIHRNFGDVTLKLVSEGKIDVMILIEGCHEPELAKALLLSNLLTQRESGVFKSGELLGSLVEGYQQPS